MGTGVRTERGRKVKEERNQDGNKVGNVEERKLGWGVAEETCGMMEGPVHTE